MTPAERQQLIDAALEGDISEADFLSLEAELTVDPAARRDYYDRVTLSLLLETEAAGTPLTDGRQGRPSMDLGASRRRWRGAFAAMATLAVVLLAIVTWQRNEPNAPQMTDREQRASVGETREKQATGFAVLSGQSDAVWTDGQSLADGGLLPAGELHLQSGIVQLELFSGVTLVVEGESRFSILSPMEVSVAQGKVRRMFPNLLMDSRF